ncbi:MAG: chromosomal replication initiator protein DnaA [Phycisphaerales bacterium]
MATPDMAIWDDALVLLRKTHPTICRHWFNTLEPSGLEGGVVTIVAPSPTYRDYLERTCSDAFDDALRTVTSRLVTSRFVAAGDESERPGTEEVQNRRPVEHPARQSRLVNGDGTLPLSPDYTFQHYVVGPDNRLAHAAACAVAENPGKAYNPYFVHGDVGLGKTHLLQAICLRIRANNPDARIFFTSCEHFMTRFMEDVAAGRMAEFRNQFRDLDVLVIDDIQFLAKRDRTQEEFFHTFNSLYQQDKQIILSSDLPPEQIPDLEERLVSRFKWGLVTHIAKPGFETRLEIVKEKARMRGLEIPESVAELIATRIETNVRELEGALTTIQLYAAVDNNPVTLELARLALGEDPTQAFKPVTIEQIVAHVTDYFGVRLADLQSRKRTRTIALPRQICMYLAREHTRHSLEEIGGYFGGRDHTTVLHAIRTIGDRQGLESEIAQALETLEAKLRSGQ